MKQNENFYAKNGKVYKGYAENHGISKEEFMLYDFLPSTDFYSSDDFSYALNLLYGLKREENFSWLAELFSIIGYDKLIQLCTYAGGETIKIPTLNDLLCVCLALQTFADINYKKLSQSRVLEEFKDNLSKDTLFKINKMYKQIAERVAMSERPNGGAKQT